MTQVMSGIRVLDAAEHTLYPEASAGAPDFKELLSAEKGMEA
jgi:hypothetical protein